MFQSLNIIIISKCAGVIFFRETFRSDYEALGEQLTTLPDKTTHDVMVTGFHLKIISMLHIFLKKLTIQALNIIFLNGEARQKKKRKKGDINWLAHLLFYRLKKHDKIDKRKFRFKGVCFCKVIG